MKLKYRKTIMSYGFFELDLASRKVILYYGGNIGNSVDHVRECCDNLIGNGIFDLLLEKATKVEGSPDYSYTVIISRPMFDVVMFNNMHKLSPTMKDNIIIEGSKVSLNVEEHERLLAVEKAYHALIEAFKNNNVC